MNNLKPRRLAPNVCMRCSCERVSVEHRNDLIDFKGLTLEVNGLAETVCQACGYRWTTEGQEKDNLHLLQAEFAVKRDAIRVRERLLTGEEVNFVLTALHLSKSEAATLFGGGPNAFSKYMSGEVLQSAPMDRLLRMTIAFGMPAVNFLRRWHETPLQLYAGGYLVCPPVSSANVSLLETGSDDASPQELDVQRSSPSKTLTLMAA